MKLDEDNGKDVVMMFGQAQKVQRFPSNEFWKNLGCLVSSPTFGLGGLRLW